MNPYSKSISSLISIILEKTAMLDQFNQWKVINLDPNIAELKFEISKPEFSDLDIPFDSFKVKFLFNELNRRPIMDFGSAEQDSSGNIKNFTIGAWITSRKDLETNKTYKVYLRIMLENILKQFNYITDEIEVKQTTGNLEHSKSIKKKSKRRRD